MIFTLVISISAILIMISSIVFFPKFKIKNREFQTFYFAPLLAAIILILFNLNEVSNIFSSLTKGSMNPIKILLLFISMSLISIILDEVNLFKYLANLALKKVKNSQIKLFITLFLLTSILTIFTSNDVIILTFTPFIIFFCKRAKIDPIPYLVSEFVAANTLSMLLIIGNPTNIYLASSSNIDFLTYFKTMLVPTLFASLTAFITLFLMFRKKLKIKIEDVEEEKVEIINKPIMVVALLVLLTTTVLLAISSYINIEMYLVATISAFTLLLFVFIFGIFYNHFEKDHLRVAFLSLKRLPYTLIPFILSMFIMIFFLKKYEVDVFLASFLDNFNPIFSYGIASTLFSNLINNIPMSVLFFEVSSVSSLDSTKTVFASIIGSNIGAYLTPIGALAGIMWMSILKRHQVKFSFIDFVKYGSLVAIPTLLSALLGLFIITL